MVIDANQAALQGRIAAVVRTDPRGGPVRRIINGRHLKPTGRYISSKARRAQPWEAKDERIAFWLSEVDPEVATYLAQPHVVTIRRHDAKPLTFYPDLRRDMVDGRVEIVEVKKDFARDADPEYRLKLELAAQVYDHLGWSFQVWERRSLDVPLVRSVVKELQRHRTVAVPDALRFAFLEALRGAGTITVAEACRLLGGEHPGWARLCALVVARVAVVDVSEPVRPETLVCAHADRRLLAASSVKPEGTRWR